MSHQDPEMASDEDMLRAITKGTKLLQMLSSSDHDAGQLMIPPRPSAQSEFTSRQSLPDYGYQRSAIPSAEKDSIRSLSTALKALEMDTQLEEYGGNNIIIDHKHVNDTWPDGPDGPKYEATDASLRQICNPAEGVLIADTNFTAPELARKHGIDNIPKLHHWSDIAFLQWLEACDETKPDSIEQTYVPEPIKYVFRLRILNEFTRSVIQRVVVQNGGNEVEAFPGITFDINSEEGKALLGTPNGAGVAWLFIQRKRELGLRTIKDVSVFYAPDARDLWLKYASLLFRIE